MDVEETKPKLKVILEHDVDIECPADMDCQWKLYSFNTRHINHKTPEELGLGPQDEYGEPKILNIGLRKKLSVGLAFILSYFEHSNSLWFIKGNKTMPDMQWDGTRIAGLLVWEHKPSDIGAKTYADREKDAEAFLESYNGWANGEGYMYRVEDEKGENKDSCAGFDDSDYMLSQIVHHLIGHDFEVQGDANYLGKEIIMFLILC